EIPYMGNSGIDDSHKIATNDINVQILNDEIVLSSVSMNKRIIPRLTAAHNVNKSSLPLYKFLHDLQLQGMARSVMWDWGELSKIRHLHRVIYKNIIVRKEKWEIHRNDINSNDNLNKQIESIKNIKKQLSIPDKVLLIEMDMTLL